RPRWVEPRRRGVILLVVLALLTLFAALGLSFVLYADAEARAARLRADAEDAWRPDMEPEQLFAFFLGQLIYDVSDDEALSSALGGHSLARGMYGCNGGPAAQSQPAANLVPYNGVGRLRAPSPFGTAVPGPAVDDYQLINYTYYPDDPQLPPGQRFLRDPERLGWGAAGPRAPRGALPRGVQTPPPPPPPHTPRPPPPPAAARR